MSGGGMTRRQFVGSSVALAGLLASSPGSLLSQELPNIVLLMGDDHGWDETGYNGHPHLVTPVLDEMARTGLRLDRFYAAAPVCSPTRASCITGRHPNRSGAFAPGWSTRPEEIGIASILAEAGYLCGHFGKWHIGPVKASSPTNPGAFGFHEWLSHDNFFEMNPTFSRNGGAPEAFAGESSEILASETLRFIEKARSQNRPFFAVVWFGSPHEPYSGRDEDLALYDDLPAEYGNRTVRLTSMETGRPTERPLNAVLRERYAEITAMDRSIGQLRDGLTKLNARDNTLIWYCSDNGSPAEGAVTSSLRGRKGHVYEGGVRSVSVMTWPARIPSPRASSVHGVTSDILPTLCALTGQGLPDRPLDGVNLTPLIDGRMTDRPDPVCFWRYPANRDADNDPYIDPELQEGTTPLVKLMGGIATRNFRNARHPEIVAGDFDGARAILDNRYKLVIDGERDTGKELFDIRSDPGETRNVIGAHPDVAERLEGRLRAWQDSVLRSLTGADYG